jgi:hypothetical protein
MDLSGTSGTIVMVALRRLIGFPGELDRKLLTVTLRRPFDDIFESKTSMYERRSRTNAPEVMPGMSRVQPGLPVRRPRREAAMELNVHALPDLVSSVSQT